jgi:hypothetical protein
MRKLVIIILITCWLCWRFPDVRHALLESLGRLFETPSSAVQQDATEQPVDSSRHLLTFAKQLAECSKPGPRVRAFVDGQKHNRPVDKLINLYAEIRERWQYVPDEGHQHQSCEYSVANWRGDCEDMSCLITAAADAANDITCRLVLCGGLKEEPNRGHAYAEALVAKDIETARPILARLGRAWQIEQISYRCDDDGSVWVALDFTPPSQIYQGKPYAFIHADGTVQIVE